ncbi:hypothetical protein [Dyella jiangningensis]|uniref:Uncharacterized protein n=1 Tax=Dyella jiangningensis TaxID=1379159 RepID=A0A328NYQ0_9GAMM|nr:hypothetical protein [Dyella jiangningensis]RAO74999.1 hypothetical protein CA260_12845 [Dyella jiangningensis]
MLLLISLSGSARSEEFEFSGLRIDWLDGYQRIDNQGQVTAALSGEDGAGVLVSVFNPKAGTTQLTPGNRMYQLAEIDLPKLAADQGKVVIPLKRSVLDNGSLLYSTATQTVNDGHAGYYLQFMLVSGGRVALFTVEGDGDALGMYSRFAPLFKSASWEVN